MKIYVGNPEHSGQTLILFTRSVARGDDGASLEIQPGQNALVEVTLDSYLVARPGITVEGASASEPHTPAVPELMTPDVMEREDRLRREGQPGVEIDDGVTRPPLGNPEGPATLGTGPQGSGSTLTAGSGGTGEGGGTVVEGAPAPGAIEQRELAGEEAKPIDPGPNEGLTAPVDPTPRPADTTGQDDEPEEETEEDDDPDANKNPEPRDANDDEVREVIAGLKAGGAETMADGERFEVASINEALAERGFNPINAERRNELSKPAED